MFTERIADPGPVVPVSPERGSPDAFARATVLQAVGSALRVVQFRGGELTYDRDDELVLSMGLTANHALDYETNGKRASVVPLIGRFGIMTPGQRFRVSLHGDCSVIQLVLPHSVLAAWLEEDHDVDGSRVEIAWGHTLEDPVVSRLLCEARVAGPAEEESVLRAVVTRLFQRFSPQARTVMQARGGLSARKVRRVIELIEDNPARAFTVEDLAREVSTSPFHFAHQFRRSTGRAPYRFVVERRLSRAVGLLANPKLRIADVAARCGFAHPSHLSRQLQRVLGQSPAQLRRAMFL